MALHPAKIIDLSHAVEDGQVTLPGYPTPKVGAFLTREASRSLNLSNCAAIVLFEALRQQGFRAEK